jgi:HK97 family phage portal protein
VNLFQRIAAWVRPTDDTMTSRVLSRPYATSGEFISGDTALKQAAVWGCLSYLSRTVAQLPWRVLRPDSTKAENTSHPVYRLLRVRPHVELGPFTFKELMVGRAASRGNAVAIIRRNNRGDPIALEPVHPDRVTFGRDDATGELLYNILQNDGSTATLGALDVFHLRGYGEGSVGLDVIEYAAESIGWARATETFGAAWFKQGMAPSGILKMKQKLTPGGKDELQKEIEEKFGGAKNAHRTLIMDFEGDYQRLAADPVVAQLIQTRQHQVEDICRWFGVPPHKVMHLLRATFSNIEHQSIEVVVDSITPWCLRMEEEANFKLFGRNPAGVYTKLDLKGLLRGDYKSRQEGLQIQRRNGIINADEWRALEDMDPIAGEGGDKYIVEGNMIELEYVGEAAEPPEPAAPAAQPGEDPEGQEDFVAEARRQRAQAQARSIH